MAQWWDHNRLLEKGSRGEDVKRLQKALNTDWFQTKPIPVTGVYDAATEALVRELQQSEGLNDDGKAGPITQSVILGGNYTFSIAQPPVVIQPPDGCWAACTESALKSTWPGWPKLTVAQLQTKYTSFINSAGLITPAGIEQMMVDQKASIKLLDPDEVRIEKISLFLFRHGTQILMGDFVAGGGHVRMIYGVTVKKGTPALLLMDPTTGYTTQDLSLLQQSTASVFLAAPGEKTVIDEL